MNYHIWKDSTNKLIHSVTVWHEDGMIQVFNPLDVAYTIAQNYRDVLVGDTVYISKNFPQNCLTFELTDEDKDVSDTLTKLGAGFYFNSDGAFLFQGGSDFNPERAAEEFIHYYRAGYWVKAPDYTLMDLEVDEIIVKRGFGRNTKVYLFHD